MGHMGNGAHGAIVYTGGMGYGPHAGLPWHRENREFESVFPDRENTGNLLKICFYTGNLPPTQGKF